MPRVQCAYYDLLKEIDTIGIDGPHLTEILVRSVDFAGLEAAIRWRLTLSDCRETRLC